MNELLGLRLTAPIKLGIKVCIIRITYKSTNPTHKISLPLVESRESLPLVVESRESLPLVEISELRIESEIRLLASLKLHRSIEERVT